ncbi:MAG: AsmA-like C-terminal region-containing protein [Acidobacteriota bacterium]|nr:AsmA-like C-terminal region-containing protein [Acidobacteriota bacterium]
MGILLCLGGAGFFIAHKWPFTREAFTRTLEQRFGRKVVIGQFRETWFPPGCIADDVRVSSQVTARKLIVQTSWTGLLSHHIGKVKVIGLRVAIAPGAAPEKSSGKESVSEIGEIEANEAVLQFPPKMSGAEGTIFQLHQLVLDHVGPNEKVSFHGSLRMDRPPGDVNAKGQFGPWQAADPGATPITGTYQFDHAGLKVFHGLGGVLSSEGKFSGTLAKIVGEGAVDVPEFHVDGSAHSAHMTAKFRASVDAQNADTVLENVEAHVGHTTILGTGNVSGGKRTDGKTARLELTVNTGRVEDLLNYFSDEKHPSMTGAVRLRAYAEVPPGPGFLKKIRLNGDFGVSGGKFTSATRQAPVNHLSESARGEKKEQQEEDPRTVLSNLKGHVVIRDGVASLQKVSFEFPGAFAEMEGIYNLIPKTVDIHGTLRTDGSLSDASSGLKAVMLKVATPFFKKSHTTVVPFSMTGRASSPSIGLDLKRKAKL